MRDAGVFVETNVLGTPAPARRGARGTEVEPVRPRVHRRGVRLDRATARGPRTTCWSRTRRTRRRRPASDLVAAAYHRTHGVPVCGHPVLQQLRAVPVPREGHPAVRHQPPRRAQGAALRRRPQRPRLAARGRPLPRRSQLVRATGPGRRDLQHRRRHRAHQPASSPRSCWTATARAGTCVEHGRGPQGPRPPLRRGHRRRSAPSWATSRSCRSTGGWPTSVLWYRDNRAVVGTMKAARSPASRYSRSPAPEGCWRPTWSRLLDGHAW